MNSATVKNSQGVHLAGERWLISRLQEDLKSILQAWSGDVPKVEGSSRGVVAGELRTFAAVLKPINETLELSASAADWQTAGLIKKARSNDEAAITQTAKALTYELASLFALAYGRLVDGQITVEAATQPDRDEAMGPTRQEGSRSVVELKARVGEYLFTCCVTVPDAILRGLAEHLQAPALLATSANVASNLDILLDVELPVTISFGSANLALKDVMKLAAGTIVELNRTASEPVEVIVNDCIVARGEVVVVDGNYGVRVTQIVSRQERWKTVV